MVFKKQLLILSMLLISCIIPFSTVQAGDISSDSSEFSLSVPAVGKWVINNQNKDFQEITVNDFLLGGNDFNKHVIILGDGTTEGDKASYFETNIENAPSQQYKIELAPSGNATHSALFEQNGSTLKIKVSGDTNTSQAVVKIILSGNNTSLPSIGTKPYSRLDYYNSITTGTNKVEFNTSEGKRRAPLDIKLDLDEGSLSFSEDIIGDTSLVLGFKLTFVAVGI